MQSNKQTFAAYQRFMGDLVGDWKEFHTFQEPSEEILKKYRVRLLSKAELKKRTRSSEPRLTFVGFGATVGAYEVDLGPFRFEINLLSIGGQHNQSRTIAKGGFGTVVKKSVQGITFVAKIIQGATADNIKEAVLEVAITKLCAMFEIGPEVETSIPYDLIVYDTAVQFHLELCQPVSFGNSNNRRGWLFQLEEHIRSGLQMLHSLHIVHKDIKPANILWSNQRRKFVLADFGIAQYVYENIGEASQTRYEGTERFVGPEMRAIKGGQKKSIDLYYNDLYGWKESFASLLQGLQEKQYYSNYQQDKLNLGKRQGDKNLPQIITSDRMQSDRSSVWLGPPGVSLRSYSSKGFEPVKDLFNRGAPVDPIVEAAYQQTDSYEFYILVYAATSLDHHTFRLKENLPKLSEQQRKVVAKYLQRSVNKPKMQAVLKELAEMSPEERAQWADWSRGFEGRFVANCVDQLPRFSYTPRMTEQFSNKLGLLMGRKELEKIKKEIKEEEDILILFKNPSENLVKIILEQQKLEQHQSSNSGAKIPAEALEKTLRDQLRPEIQSNSGHEHQPVPVASVVMRNIYGRLIQQRDQIQEQSRQLRERFAISKQQILVSMSFLIQSFFSYDTKEYLLTDLHYVIVENKPRNQEYIKVFFDVISKKGLPSQLLDYIRKEDTIERCVWLVRYYFYLSNDRSDQMLTVCSMLLDRLRHQPQECCYLETVNVKHILLKVKYSRRQLYHTEVKSHFEECLQLLLLHRTYHNAKSVLWLMAQKLNYFYHFSFPEKDTRAAHADFEMYRQFYCETTSQDANQAVSNNKVQYSLAENDKPRHAIQQIHSEKLRKRERHNSGTLSSIPESSITDILNEALAWMRICKHSVAEQLLRSAKNKLSSTENPKEHRDYYGIQSQIYAFKNNLREAERSCRKAIQFSDRLATSKEKILKEATLLTHLAQFIRSSNRYGECFRYLTKARQLLSSFPEEHEQLALNYDVTAETLWCAGRLGESSSYCKQVIRMQLQKKIPRSQAVFAHVTMMKISKAWNRPVLEQLEHSWMALDKTVSLGDTITCMAYTTLLEHSQETVGDEPLSLISFARKFTDPPDETFRGGEVAEVLYEQDIPTGKLPFDMTTESFILSAEKLLRELTGRNHIYCCFIKTRFLKTVDGYTSDQPQYKLLYVRLGVEICLHWFLLGFRLHQSASISDFICDVIGSIEKYNVNTNQEYEKQQLVSFATELLERAKKNEPKVFLSCMQKQLIPVPNSYRRKSQENRQKGQKAGTTGKQSE